MDTSKTTLLKPRLSEKSYVLGTTKRVYVFDVPGDANKHIVADAVTAQYKVVVTEVNITNIKGKVKRLIRKGGRPVMGRRSDYKKAYVTLAEGHKLPFFDEPEEEKSAKADKKTKTTKKAKETK
jgi:large subunit ribosomal protein L23